MAKIGDSGHSVGEVQSIQFIDLKAQQARIRPAVDAAIARVLDHGQYIMGPEVRELEAKLAAFAGVRHAISMSSGTDALLVILMALGIGPGDAVICPAFTYTATPECIALLGATPVLAEVCADTFNIDPERLPSAIEAARRAGLRPRALMPVDLFGMPADYDVLEPLAKEHGLFLVCDAAQSFGAKHRGKRIGGFGVATATSFFPAKPLGCYGDGGAIFTDDDELAATMRSIRTHGSGGDKYDIVRVGINGRLDTIQAAILLQKLAIFEDEIEARQRWARAYNDKLADVAIVPKTPQDKDSVWAQYTLRVRPEARDALMKKLSARGVPSAVYYPRGLHEQTAYRHCPTSVGGVGVSERLAREVLSLPMHPYLDVQTHEYIVESFRLAATK